MPRYVGQQIYIVLFYYINEIVVYVKDYANVATKQTRNARNLNGLCFISNELCIDCIICLLIIADTPQIDYCINVTLMSIIVYEVHITCTIRMTLMY